MNTALAKSAIAAGTGFFASVTALFYGYANLTMLAFLGTFLLALSIQYGALKIKVMIPFVAGFGFLYFFLNNLGLKIDDLLNTFSFLT